MILTDHLLLQAVLDQPPRISGHDPALQAARDLVRLVSSPRFDVHNDEHMAAADHLKNGVVLARSEARAA